MEDRLLNMNDKRIDCPCGTKILLRWPKARHRSLTGLRNAQPTISQRKAPHLKQGRCVFCMASAKRHDRTCPARGNSFAPCVSLTADLPSPPRYALAWCRLPRAVALLPRATCRRWSRRVEFELHPLANVLPGPVGFLPQERPVHFRPWILIFPSIVRSNS